MNWSDRKFQVSVILLLVALTAAVLGLDTLSGDQSTDSVAYVNLEKIFAEHPAKTAAEQTLNNKAAEYTRELETEAADLSGVEQKELLRKYQVQLHELEEELLAQVTKEIEEIIIKTAEEKNVKFVLEEDYVIYGGYNLTEEVLARIDESWEEAAE
jgi:outer membrane protein